MNLLPEKIFIVLLLLTFTSCYSYGEKDQQTPPNIVLIVADDLGYSDLRAYGGEIHTPNLDAIISSGIAFTDFQTAPFCAVTRAMLLSGNDNHIAGMGSQDLVTGHFGYEGMLTDRIVPISELLREAGYRTVTTGKWHLGTTAEANPVNKGFDHSFVILEGGGNHYNSKGIFPGVPESPYTENGVKADWPEGRYSTNFYTDKIIEYLEVSDQNKPFFVYAAYTSPHWPLQVDPEYRKKYEGVYDEGYEALKHKRFERLKELGIIPKGAVMPPPHPRVKPWDSLSDQEKRKETRKMELFAGMVDNLDVNIGRLKKYLKDTGQFENTIIVFMSDNGAAAEDFYTHPYFGPFLQQHYTDDYASMGEPNSFISYGPQWAEAGASPFKYFKGYTTLGGMTAPLIISGPGTNSEKQYHHSFATVMDLAPTIYDWAGIDYPDFYNGNQLYQLKGKSLQQVLSGTADMTHDSSYVFALEHRGYVQIRKGKWKLNHTSSPFDEDSFELHDLTQDLAEQKDLKNEFPEVFNELMQEWYKYRDEVGVIIPTPESGSGF